MRKHESSDRVSLEKSKMETNLSVQMDKNLRFSQHIETHFNKANRLLGLITRSYEHLDAESMQLLVIAFVRPHLEFGNVVCFPRQEKDKKLVEGVQRRATKIISGLNDLTYEQRLGKNETTKHVLQMTER